MATGALQHGSPDFFHRAMRLAEIETASVPSCTSEVPVAATTSSEMHVSRASALGVVRGTMVALSIEATAAVGIYGIWMFARFLGL
jgi:hypothetical protein